FTFLFIGRLIKDKGVFEFIEAARKIKRDNPEIKFKIIGPLWRQSFKSNSLSEETINSWVKEEVVEYLGEKTDVRNDISMADCIVLPSYREGTSNVLLEASSMEKPCIASNVPGCKEVIDHGVSGYLCEVQNSPDLAEKMQAMFSLDPLARNEMGKMARQKMIREFDKKIVIERYLQEIKFILSPAVNHVFSIPRVYNNEKEVAYTGMHLAG
ncbi:MAG: glycosyltransferase, partial [Ginsengibacter sp.]